MIYKVTNSRVIKQGDIFFDLPFIDLKDFDELEIVTDTSSGTTERKSWNEVKNQEDIKLYTKVVPTYGIVISQDCDNIRKNYISFAKVETFANFLKKPALPNNQKELLALMIKESSKRGYSFYYLPEGIGFPDKMAADFKTIFQLPRKSLLNNLSNMRKGTLGKEMSEHFRQTISNYFTRYAYSEWYPLTQAEFQIYYNNLPLTEKPNVSSFPHQRRRE